MIRRLKAGISLALVACIFSACATAPMPPRQAAPIESLPTHSLKLALIVTEKTRQSQNQINAFCKFLNIYDPNKIFNDFALTLDQGFKSVAAVNTLEEAKASGADLTAVLDIGVKPKRPTAAGIVPCAMVLMLPCFIFFSSYFTPAISIEGTTKFLSPDGQTIDIISFDAKRKNDFYTPNIFIREASSDARAAFINGMAASTALAKFARDWPAGASSKPEALPAKALEPIAKGGHPAIISDVDRPGYKVVENPNNYALVVGVEGYENLPEARFAQRDAESVRGHLVAMGYPVRNIVYLSGERAGRAALEKNIESWLPRNINDESRVFVYFSGHGASDAKTRQAYLLPWDADPNFLTDTGYPIKRLYEKLNALPAREIFVVMDASFDGTGGRSVMAKGTRPLITRIDLSVTEAGRLVVFSASAGDEAAGIQEDQGHGAFTYNLLKALNEKGGKSSIGEIYEAILPRVKDAARQRQSEQTPQLLPASEAKRSAIRFEP